jgi:hypothetical protein
MEKMKSDCEFMILAVSFSYRNKKFLYSLKIDGELNLVHVVMRTFNHVQSYLMDFTNFNFTQNIVSQNSSKIF